MASVANSYISLPKKTYLTSAPYNNAIYQLVNIGDILTGEQLQLQAIPGLTAASCPKGSLLRETGKKVYPGQYLNTSGTTNQQYLVSVFDDQTFTRGFINPAGEVFAPMSTDQPAYVADLRNVTGSETQYDAGFGHDNLGPPVYTWGTILANGNMDISGNEMLYGNLTVSTNTFVNQNLTVSSNTLLYRNLSTLGNSMVAGNLNVLNNIQSKSTITVVSGQFRSASIPPYTLNTNGTISIDCAQGQVHVINVTANTTGAAVSITLDTIDSTNSGSLANLGGTVIYLLMYLSATSSNNNLTIVFGSTMYEVGGLTITNTNGGLYTAIFVCDGSKYIQVGTTQKVIQA